MEVSTRKVGISQADVPPFRARRFMTKSCSVGAFRAAQPHRVLYYWHRIGNGVLTTLSNMFTDLDLTDMETGCKLFRREIIQCIQIEENGFGFQPEITAEAG
jgi:hypothetical protein